MLLEQVADGAARDGEERAAREAAKEAGDDNGGNVLAKRLGKDEEEEDGPGDEVDGAAAVELAHGAEQHGPKGDAQHKRRQAEDGDDARVAEFGFHLFVGGGIDGGEVCSEEC